MPFHQKQKAEAHYIQDHGEKSFKILRPSAKVALSKFEAIQKRVVKWIYLRKIMKMGIYKSAGLTIATYGSLSSTL